MENDVEHSIVRSEHKRMNTREQTKLDDAVERTVRLMKWNWAGRIDDQNESYNDGR